MSDLRDRHAIVTGAGSGIGGAIAMELAAQGARVTLLGRDRDRLESQADAVQSAHGGEAVALLCDVSDPATVTQAFRAARDRQGPAYVLVNNAGQADAAPVMETDLGMWQRLLAVNLTGPFLCLQEVLPAMLESKAGRIVNIASMAGLKGYSHTAAYTASKHGLVGLTRAVAVEVAKHGITVNAVCPGYTDTGMAERAVANLVRAGRSETEARALIRKTIPRGRLIQTEEVAATVAWLCSPGAAAITGQAIPVSGGEH